MRKLIVSFVAALMLSVSVYAAQLAIPGCTLDHKSVRLTLVTADNTPTEVEKHIATAFATAAKDLTAEELLSDKGYNAFVSQLTPADIEAILELQGPPDVIGSCELAKN